MELRGILGTREVDAGGHDVEDVAGLVVNRAGVRDLAGPVGDEGGADAALVGVVLVEGQRGVAGVGPGAPVAEHAAGAAHFRQILTGVEDVRLAGRAAVDAVAGGMIAVVGGVEVEAVWVPLGAGAVVAEEHDESVVEFAIFPKRGDQAADILVEGLDSGGVDGHALGEIGLTGGFEGVPGWVVAVVGHGAVAAGDVENVDLFTGREGGFFVDETELLHAFETFLTDDVPALSVGFDVGRGEFWRGLDREVGGLEGDVEEPGGFFGFGAGDVEEVERVVGDGVGGEVGAGLIVALGVAGGESDHHRRVPGIDGVTVCEAVELVEASGDGAGVVDVPLSASVGAVTGGVEDLGQSDATVGEMASVTRQLTIAHEPADAGLMRVEAGEQAGSRRTAARAVVEGRKAEPVARRGRRGSACGSRFRSSRGRSSPGRLQE